MGLENLDPDEVSEEKGNDVCDMMMMMKYRWTF